MFGEVYSSEWGVEPGRHRKQRNARSLLDACAAKVGTGKEAVTSAPSQSSRRVCICEALVADF